MNSRSLYALITALILSSCAAADAAQDGASQANAAREGMPIQELPTVVVYKSESCGCCNGWVEHLRAAGFHVDARNVADLQAIKRDLGVPAADVSCHTALVDGYVVEGHVPADVVKRLLTERPQIAGIATPGMPIGSPGMEGPGAKPYQVRAFDRQGRSTVYAEIDPR